MRDQFNEVAPSSDSLVRQITEAYPTYLGWERAPLRLPPESGIIYPTPVTTITAGVMRDIPGSDTFRNLWSGRVDKKDISAEQRDRHMFFFVHGSILEAAEKRYLMAPKSLGEGGMYDIYAANEFPGRNFRLLRIIKERKFNHIAERDARSLEVWTQFHEIPRLVTVETDPIGRKVIVLDQTQVQPDMYSVEALNTLSDENLLRLTRMQWFAFKRWLDAGCNYFDWQEEDMVRWRYGTDAKDIIEGFQMIDWSPMANYPYSNDRGEFYQKFIEAQAGDTQEQIEFFSEPQALQFLYQEGIIQSFSEKEIVSGIDKIIQRVDRFFSGVNYLGYDSMSRADTIASFIEMRINRLSDRFNKKHMPKILSGEEIAPITNAIEKRLSSIEDEFVSNNPGKNRIRVYEGDADIRCEEIDTKQSRL